MALSDSRSEGEEESHLLLILVHYGRATSSRPALPGSKLSKQREPCADFYMASSASYKSPPRLNSQLEPKIVMSAVPDRKQLTVGTI